LGKQFIFADANHSQAAIVVVAVAMRYNRQ
jgi:hypothetical protein